LAGACGVKLKDYEIPQYGLDDGAGQEDLEQYSLKNFDLKAYQLTQTQLEIPSPNPVAEPLTQPSFSHAPDPAPPELSQFALEPCDVKFGLHFNLQTVSYNPLSPSQPWKMPRWVVTMVGLFFGSAAVLTLAFCVVLLRAPAPIATAPAAPADVTPAASAPAHEPTTKSDFADRAAVRHSVPAPANPIHDDPAAGHRMVVSRHPNVVRRHPYGPRRVVSRSTSASVAPQETETASTRPPKDALDQLLSESSL
jgi:hypothetical protein